MPTAGDFPPAREQTLTAPEKHASPGNSIVITQAIGINSSSSHQRRSISPDAAPPGIPVCREPDRDSSHRDHRKTAMSLKRLRPFLLPLFLLASNAAFAADRKSVV